MCFINVWLPEKVIVLWQMWRGGEFTPRSLWDTLQDVWLWSVFRSRRNEEASVWVLRRCLCQTVFTSDASHVAVMRSDCDLLVLSFVQLVQMVSFRVLPVAVSVLIFCVTATMTVAIWATSRTAVSTFAMLRLGSQIEIRSVHEENPLALCTCSVRELTGADPTVRRASYASFVCMTEISSSHSQGCHTEHVNASELIVEEGWRSLEKDWAGTGWNDCQRRWRAEANVSEEIVLLWSTVSDDDLTLNSNVTFKPLIYSRKSFFSFFVWG